jgi:hypothetical protein
MAPQTILSGRRATASVISGHKTWRNRQQVSVTPLQRQSGCEPMAERTQYGLTPGFTAGRLLALQTPGRHGRRLQPVLA